MIIDCFRGSGASMDNLRELFIESVLKLAAAGKDIDFKNVYSEVVKNRSIDIDMESGALLYDDIKNDSRITSLHDNIHVFMTTSQDLQVMREGEIGRVLRTIGKSVDKQGKITFQRVNTPKALALSFLRTINNKTFGNIANTDGAAIKKFVNNYAKSLLGEKNATGKKTVDLIAEMLEKNMMSSDFTGTSEDLFEAMKGVLGDITSKIADPSLRATFEHEIQKIREVAFNFGMTESKRKNILYDVLKNSEYGKTDKNGKKLVDWNKLAREEDMEAALRKVLSVKLDKLGYTGNKSKVYAALINNIKGIQMGKAYQKAVSSNLFKNELGREVAIDMGFYKETHGRKVVDYKANNPSGRKKLKEILIQGGYNEATAEDLSQRGLSASDIRQGITLESVFDIIGADYSKFRSVPAIAALVRTLMIKNNKPYTHKINEMDRLVKLQEAGYGLDSTTDALSASILGVRIKPSLVDKMQDIVKRYSEVMANPDEIYAEIMAANPNANFKFDYQGNIPLGFWASNTLERLNREMSDLIIESTNDESTLLKGLDFFEKLQRTSLSAMLTNEINIPQNLGTAFNTLAVSGKKVLGEKKFKKFLALVLMDANGSLVDPTTMHREFKDWSEADSFKEKVGAFYRSATQGVLAGIDGMAYYTGTKRTFYNGIKDALKIKLKNKLSSTAIDNLLAPYFDNDATAKSYAMAKHFFSKAGITPSRIGEKRYKRELEAEAFNVQMSLLMSGDLITGKYFTAEEIVMRKEAAERLTRGSLGKELFSVMKKGDKGKRVKTYKNNIPLLANFFALVGREHGVKYNAAIKKFSENPTFMNGLDVVKLSGLKMFLHGGPTRFGSGILVFADMAFGTLRPHGLGKGYKKRYAALIKENNQGEAANLEDVMEAYEEMEINRRRNYLTRSAWAISIITLSAIGAIVAASGRDDDDETDIIDETVTALHEMGEEHPTLKAIFTRIMPLQIRLLYALMDSKNIKNKMRAVERVSSTLFSTGPVDLSTIVSEYVDRDGLAFGKLGDLATSTFLPNPVAAIGGILLSPVNRVQDEIAGNRLRRDYDVSQLNAMSFQFRQRFINGAIIGLTNHQLNYFLQRNKGADMGIMKDDGIRNPKEYDILKGRSFYDVDWSVYGNDKLNDKKEKVDLALDQLQPIQNEIFNIGSQYKIPRFNKSQTIERSFKNPRSDMFTVDTKYFTFEDLQTFGYKEMPKTVNIANLAMMRLGLDKQLRIQDLENAIKYRNFQNSLD